MGRKNDLEKALALAAEVMGKPLEIPVESKEDLIREATAALNYYYSTGKEWYSKICGTCEEPFKFMWTSKGVGYCSIPCAMKALEKIGLKWDPSKSPTERWGRFLPAVVPPAAVKIIDETRPEPEPDDIDQLLAEFD